MIVRMKIHIKIPVENIHTDFHVENPHSWFDMDSTWIEMDIRVDDPRGYP